MSESGPPVPVPPVLRVVVIGAGLIGASVGCALTAHGHRVHVQDLIGSHARVAASLGAGTTETAVPDEVDVVVVAVPPRALPSVITGALETFPRATVTDVGSVKAGVLDALWGHGALDRYVGSHPMAGSQHSGPVTAQADLFVDRTWVITPHRRSGSGAVAQVTGLAQACGARTVVMDVAEHDAAVARVSHLPYLMSVLTAAQLVDTRPEDLALAGQGLRDVVRVAASDPGLWEQIVSSNATAVLRELRDVQSQLGAVIGTLESLDAPEPTDELRGRLEQGVRGTRRIPGKHGATPTAYAEVVVAIPDAPGALGRLFADVGAAGVNVEDISIEHDADRQVGYLSLAIAPDQADGLATTMADLGWEVHAPTGR